MTLHLAFGGFSWVGKNLRKRKRELRVKLAELMNGGTLRCSGIFTISGGINSNGNQFAICSNSGLTWTCNSISLDTTVVNRIDDLEEQVEKLQKKIKELNRCYAQQF